jgi:hypothetical protein
VVSIVRRPGMTDAQYRAARKRASDFTRRQKQRHRARNKKGPSKIYIDPITGVRSTHPFIRRPILPTLPRKGRVQLVPQRPSTLTPIQLEQQKRFQKELQKQRDIFNKNISKQGVEGKQLFGLKDKKMVVPKPGDPSKIPIGPTGKHLKKAKSPRQLKRERIQKEAAANAAKQFNATSQNQVKQFYDQLGARNKILKARGPVKPTKQPSVTSRYRGGSGKKKYNQAAYFAGLGVNPNTKQNQGIYKPYANGGGVRKPKYKE